MRIRATLAVLTLVLVAGVMSACVHNAPSTHPPVAQVAIVGIKAADYIGQAQQLAKTLEQQGVLPTATALQVQQALRDASQVAKDQLVPVLREVDAATDDVEKAKGLDKARALSRDLIAAASRVFPALANNPSVAALATLIDQIIAQASGLTQTVTASAGA